MVAPLRPLITPFTWSLCAAAIPHSRRIAAKVSIGLAAVLTLLLFILMPPLFFPTRLAIVNKDTSFVINALLFLFSSFVVAPDSAASAFAPAILSPALCLTWGTAIQTANAFPTAKYSRDEWGWRRT